MYAWCVGHAIDYGGEAKGHSVAQLDSWIKIQQFFRSRLLIPAGGQEYTEDDPMRLKQSSKL